MIFDKAKAIIFDMDGVIIDSEPVHVEAERATCQKFKIDIPLSEWENFKGKTAVDIFSYINSEFCNGMHDVEKLIEYNTRTYLEIAFDRIVLIDGAIDFIGDVKAKSYQLALTTSSKKAMQQLAFDKFNLHDFFDIVVTGDEVLNGKPHPEPYLKTIKKLNLKAGNCVVVEDSISGIMSAKSAGCLAVGIITTYNENLLYKAGADIVVTNYDELKKFLS